MSFLSVVLLQTFLELSGTENKAVVVKPLSKEEPKPYVIMKAAKASWNIVSLWNQ